MPSRKGTEQAMNWLRSKMANQEDILEAINAEVCYNVIMDQRERLDKLGIQFNALKQSMGKRRSSDSMRREMGIGHAPIKQMEKRRDELTMRERAMLYEMVRQDEEDDGYSYDEGGGTDEA